MVLSNSKSSLNIKIYWFSKEILSFLKTNKLLKMKKILTNENVVDPGLHLFGAIFFLIPYFTIIISFKEFEINKLIFKILLIMIIHFFPAVSCFLFSQILANKKKAENVAGIGGILFIIAIIGMILFFFFLKSFE